MGAALVLLASAAPAGAQTITTNEPWRLDDDTSVLGRSPAWTGDLPLTPRPFRVDLSTYQTRLAACQAHPNCEPTLVRAPVLFNGEYGWWCGGGRPVDGDVARDMGPLDPVDMCCKLHDKQVWSDGQKSCNPAAGFAEHQILDACGIYMCLTSRTPSDWSSFPPEVEEARVYWANAALSLCLSGCANTPTSDQDCDGATDDADLCPLQAPAGSGHVDTDGDAIGNICDCDFDNDGRCGIQDFNVFLPDFVAGQDGGAGTDMNASGSVGIDDFNAFLPGFAAGEPGPGRPASCQGLQQCGNGFCERPAENCGQSLLGCPADCGLCEPGRFCLVDGDCDTGICSNTFQCIDCRSNGQVCTRDAACCSGICNNAFLCASCRSNGQACLTDDVCCSGICNNAFQCASCRSNGQACLTSGVCCSGICNGLFQCASCKSFGQACGGDGECCSGNCNILNTCGA